MSQLRSSPRILQSYLQTLKLNGCWSLNELPRDINKMVSRRHLELFDCDSLICMPHELGPLTHLQTLTKFVLDDPKMSHTAKISELHGLSSLRGKLAIERLYCQRSNIEEIEFAELLMEKPYLQELELLWSTNSEKKIEYPEQVGHKDEKILEALEPHHTIKILYMRGFMGKRLLECIGTLTLLLKRQIIACDHLESFPESIGNLISLKKLELINCFALTPLPESIKYLTTLEKLKLSECHTLASLPDSIGNLTSLHVLKLSACSALASLPESMGNLTSLHELRITGCFVLTSLPEGIRNLRCLHTLKIYGSPQLKKRCKHEGVEDWPKIAHIPNVHA